MAGTKDLMTPVLFSNGLLFYAGMDGSPAFTSDMVEAAPSPDTHTFASSVVGTSGDTGDSFYVNGVLVPNSEVFAGWDANQEEVFLAAPTIPADTGGAPAGVTYSWTTGPAGAVETPVEEPMIKVEPKQKKPIAIGDVLQFEGYQAMVVGMTKHSDGRCQLDLLESSPEIETSIFRLGVKVKIKPLEPSNFNRAYRSNVLGWRYGEVGTIIGFNKTSQLTFKVRHEDGMTVNYPKEVCELFEDTIHDVPFEEPVEKRILDL